MRKLMIAAAALALMVTTFSASIAAPAKTTGSTSVGIAIVGVFIAGAALYALTLAGSADATE